MSPSTIIFDLGGVVLASPLDVLRDFTEQQGVPLRAIGDVFEQGGDNGPWQRLERGEITMSAFIEAFDQAAVEAGTPFSSAEMMQALEVGLVVRPMVRGTIRTLRARGFVVAALTNNWACGEGMQHCLDELRPEFDVFVESWRVGMRKPEVRIYQHILKLLDAHPSQTVFLDDFGENLRTARNMGMTTILVRDIAAAMKELDKVLVAD